MLFLTKNEESIGGLKTHQKVTKDLYWLSLVFPSLSPLVGGMIQLPALLLMHCDYGLVKHAYSFTPSIRIKNTLVELAELLEFFQGYFNFLP